MTAKKHGPWTIHGSELKYRHELMKIYEDEVTRPNGEPGVYAFASIKPGVAVLAIDEENFVYLVREFRYAVGRESVEVVGGAIDEGEEASDAARRELKEELGIEAKELTPLGRVDPITSIIDSPSNLFLARGLTFGETDREGGESISTVKLKLEEAARRALTGEITHGASCVLILRAREYLSEKS
ncbi:MAG TPA: NUDIX hydrolase [Pyrinomonadaceae bacterium]|nr:NUDIX hydrolase [Pyrinomonadaceae bacterium]